MTVLEKRSLQALQAWCKKQKLTLVGKPNHLHTRAYVIAKAAPMCLIVAYPMVDAEPQIQNMSKAMSLSKGIGTIHKFDNSLEMGDWVTTAYCCFAHGTQEVIAIPVVK